MSHARALAYESMVMVLSGFIAAVGLAAVLEARVLRRVVEELGTSLAPGPTGRLIGEATRQGAAGGTSAAFLGLGLALVAGTLAMAQVERSANRIAGVDEDRRGSRRYVVAFLLAVTVGVLFMAGALVVGGGRALASGIGWRDAAERVWSFLRWPVGAAIVLFAAMLLYRVAPRRRLGSMRAIVGGSVVAVALWLAFTGLLSLYFAVSTSSTYGPLLSIVALLLWSLLTSVALHVGMATVCELSGAPHPDGADSTVRIPEAPRRTQSRPG